MRARLFGPVCVCVTQVIHLYYMKDSHLTLRIPAELARALARKAKALGIPKSQMAREAVTRYLVPSAGEEAPSRLPTARQFAARWRNLPRLSADDADAFAADIEASRRSLPPVSSSWE